MVTQIKVHTCHYCGIENEAVIPAEYYDENLKRDVYDGWACKDIQACLDREAQRDAEWAKALAIEE